MTRSLKHIIGYSLLRSFQIVTFTLLTTSNILAQEFKTLPEGISSRQRPLVFENILCTSSGPVLIGSSTGLSEIDGLELNVPLFAGSVTDDKGQKAYLGKNPNIYKDLYELFSGIKLLCEGPDKIIYVVSENNNIGWINHKLSRAIGHPPFNFPTDNGHQKVISKIWIDSRGDLYVVTTTGTFIVRKATRVYKQNTEDSSASFAVGLDADSNYVVTLGARPIEKIDLPAGIVPSSFAENPDDNRYTYIGTNAGLLEYDKQTGQSSNYFKDGLDKDITITHLDVSRFGSVVWFSTTTRGMGKLNLLTNRVSFFTYPTKSKNRKDDYRINTFSRKSKDEFFVAIADSLPAVFNSETGSFSYINDSVFHRTQNKTTDIKADPFGNLYITKGGGLYWSKTWIAKSSSFIPIDSSLFGPFITDIVVNGIPYRLNEDFYGKIEMLQEINLNHNENTFTIHYSSRGIDADSLQYAWKMDNYSDDWLIIPYSILDDELNMVSFHDLRPGKYVFRVRAGKINGSWMSKQVELGIVVNSPFWETWWFPALIIIALSIIVFAIIKWRVSIVRKQERRKIQHEKELLELEAKALRAQMNPHFIFNCMNSIKSLIQQKNEDKAVSYLTTFSKLLRTILQNSDKREITLYDEIETCKLYTQLESMRFDNKFDYHFNIDGTIDLKSIRVPALIIQPFIENAIWHGIVPKEGEGSINISVKLDQSSIKCIIDDDGIGREISKQNKFKGEPSTHQSKGVRLTQTRLDLDNALNQRNAVVGIYDKKDVNGNATGTTVVLTFAEY